MEIKEQQVAKQNMKLHCRWNFAHQPLYTNVLVICYVLFCKVAEHHGRIKKIRNCCRRLVFWNVRCGILHVQVIAWWHERGRNSIPLAAHVGLLVMCDDDGRRTIPTQSTSEHLQKNYKQEIPVYFSVCRNFSAWAFYKTKLTRAAYTHFTSHVRFKVYEWNVHLCDENPARAHQSL